MDLREQMIDSDPDIRQRQLEQFLMSIGRGSMPPAVVLPPPVTSPFPADRHFILAETYLVSPRGAFGGRVVGARDWTRRRITTCVSALLP